MTSERWQRATEWPLMVAAVAFLIAYALPILHTGIGPDLHGLLDIIAWATWALFAVDYVARLVLAEDRRHFFVHHLLDLVVIALPLLRPLTLLRLVSPLRVLNRRATVGLRGRVALYIGGGAGLLAFCGALAVLEEERGHPGANIQTFPDALWWAVTTMTTVGYGDLYPTTHVGRLAAVGLMLGGIALLSMGTATLASWLVRQVNVSEQRQTARLEAAIAVLNAKVDRLLADRAGLADAGPAHPRTEA